MSELFSDEFLSAYLDGELSPHERAAVERWIERAPEARQRLEDFRGLSRLFGDLSRTELPREFPTEVLHLAERRMLLPDAAWTGGRRRIRGWTLALAATAAAAGLLLTLTVLNVDDRARGIPGVARNDAPAPAGNFAEPGKPTAPREHTGEHTNVQLAQDERRLQPRADGAERAMPVAAAGGAAGGFAGGAAPAAGATTVKADASDSSLSGTVESDRQLQAIHTAVYEMRRSGASDKYLLVVRARAVDRADGLVLLQKDFADNNILADARDAGKGKPLADDTPSREASSEGLYIEADADTVIAGFKTILARRHPGVQFVIEPSIELAALEPQLQRSLLGSGADRSGVDPGRRDDAAKESQDADAKSSKKSPPTASQRRNTASTSRTSQPSGAGRGSIERSARVPVPDKNEKAADEKDSPTAAEAGQLTNNSRQIVVPIVPQSIQNRTRSSRDANSAAAKSDFRGQKEKASARGDRSDGEKASDDRPVDKQTGEVNPGDGKAGNEKSGDVRPHPADEEKPGERSPVLVRMLIVIESEPQQPAAPADKKGPSGGAS